MSGTIENPYENFIALSRYARWLEKQRRDCARGIAGFVDASTAISLLLNMGDKALES